VHNATGDPLRNNSVPVGPGGTASRTARALHLSPNSLVKQYPELNVLINNAGIMKVDNVHNPVDDALISSIVTTNLLGPVRMTSALIEHLKQQHAAWVIHLTSGTAFVPMAVTATYNATKAALHLVLAFATVPAQRHQRQVLEVAPPYVQTELMGLEQAVDPRARPLREFVDETIRIPGTDEHEIMTERVDFLRNAAGPNDAAATKQVNDWFAGGEH
jgi:uncharacterized oxidoreductase